MTGHCRACESRLPARAAWCPTCGAAVVGDGAVRSSADVELPRAPLDDGFLSTTTTVIETGPHTTPGLDGDGGGGRRRVNTALFVVALVAALVAVAALTRSPDAPITASSSSTTTTTAARTSTTVAAPTTAAGTAATTAAPDAAPDPSGVARTSTTLPAAIALDLPAGLTGHLVAATSDGPVLIDLAARTAQPLDGGLDVYTGVAIWRTDEALVGTYNGELAAAPVNGARQRLISGAGQLIIDPLDRTAAWINDGDGELRQLDAQGRLTPARITVPARAQVMGLIGGRFLLSDGQSTYRWDPTTGIADQFLDVTVGWIRGVWAPLVRCDPQLSCAIWLIDLRDGSQHQVPTRTTVSVDLAWGAIDVSPDGRFVTVAPTGLFGDGTMAIRLIDVADATEREVVGPASADGSQSSKAIRSVAFGDDGSLFYVAGTHLVVVQSGGEPITVDVASLAVHQIVAV